MREFLYVDDLADALVHLAKTYSGEGFVNVGSGEEVSIGDLARLVAEVVGFGGEMRFDATKPDGTARKLVDVSKLHAMGWRHTTGLREGLVKTYAWFMAHQGDLRGYETAQ